MAIDGSPDEQQTNGNGRPPNGTRRRRKPGGYVIGVDQESAKVLKHLRVGGYGRTSRRAGRGESFHSDTDQRKAIEGWCAANGHEMLFWEFDENVSGGKRSRPGLNRLIKRVERDEIDCIASMRWDRLARLDVTSRALLIDDIYRAGGVVASAEEGGVFDKDNPMEGFTFGLMSEVATLQRETMRTRNIGSVHYALERKIPPHPDNYGYRRAGQGVPDRLPAQFVPDGLDEGEPGWVVGKMYELKDAGWTIDLIRAWLIAQHIRTDADLPPEHWSNGRIRAILHNPTYMGDIQVGEAYIRDAHDPLVSRSVWERVQATFATGGWQGMRPNGAPLLLPPKRVRCGGCGYLMVARPHRKGCREYACRGVANKSHHCGCSAAIRDATGPRTTGLAEYVVRRTREHLEEDYRATLFDTGAAEIRQARARLEAAERRVTEIGADWRMKEEKRPTWNALSDSAEEELRDARAALREAFRTSEPSLDLGRPRDDLRDQLDAWAEMLRTGKQTIVAELMPREELHRILSQMIQAVIIYPTPQQPLLVAEAQKLAAKGVQLKTIGRLFGRHEGVIAGWIKNPNATGAEWSGASAERVRIVWRDDPPLEVPRPGKRDWVRRDFPFADRVGMPAEPASVPEYSLEELLREQPVSRDQVRDVLAQSDKPLTAEELQARFPDLETPSIRKHLRNLRDEGRVRVVGQTGENGLAVLWGVVGAPNGSAYLSRHDAALDEVFEVLDRDRGKPLTVKEIGAALPFERKEAQVGRLLTELREQGRAERVERGRSGPNGHPARWARYESPSSRVEGTMAPSGTPSETR
jgi:DNA invertase Pin-like site-specific DNA recombinase